MDGTRIRREKFERGLDVSKAKTNKLIEGGLQVYSPGQSRGEGLHLQLAGLR